ncbi:MAG: alkaline phosphatase family protein [Acidobacteriota bacterium]
MKKIIITLIIIICALILISSYLSFVRIPADHIGITSGSIYGEGIHCKLPYARILIIPASSSLELDGIEISSRERLKGVLKVRMNYLIDPSNIPAPSRKVIVKNGRAGFLTNLLAEGSREIFPLFPAADISPRARISEVITQKIMEIFSKHGITISDLNWSVTFTDPAFSARMRDEVESKINPTDVKLLIIGLDAADWQIIDPLMKSGKLPNLQRLVKNGVRATMRSIDPMMSPLLWTTIATGQTPDVHGIADFLAYDPSSQRKIPITSNFRKARALWNILSDFNRRSAFIAWWATFPAEDINGIMVTELLTHSFFQSAGETKEKPYGITDPPEYYDEIKGELHNLEDITYHEVRRFIDITQEEFREGQSEARKPPQKDEDGGTLPVQHPVAFMIKALAATKNYHRVALDILDRGDFDLVSVYYEAIDMVGHRFQHCLPPQMKICSDEDFRKYSRAVTEFYIYQDKLIGELLRKIDRDTVVMVISDHGFRYGSDRPEDILPYTTNQPVEWHNEYGIFILSGPYVARGDIGRVSLLEIFPTVLAIMGFPQPEDIRGRIIEKAFTPEFFQKFPTRWIASYEAFGERPGMEQPQIPLEAQEEMLANLRALGYIGAEDTKPSKRPSATNDSDRKARDLSDRAADSGESKAALETNATYHRNLATFHLKQGDLKKAEEQLLLAQKKKRLPKTYEMLAEIYAQQSRIEDAIKMLEEALNHYPDLGDDDILWIVELYLTRGDIQSAYSAYEKWKSRIKKGAVRNACLGRLAEFQKNKSDAERYYQLSLEEDPALVSTALKLFYLLESQGRGDEIEPIIRKALGKIDRIDEYHNILGVLNKRKGNIDEAIKEFRKALEIYPDSEKFLFNLGTACMAIGDWNDAKLSLERAASLGSRNPSLWINLGSTYLQSGETTEALEAFQNAKKYGATGSSAHYGIALAYARLEKNDQAIAAAHEGLSINPSDENLKSLYSSLIRHNNSSSK